MTIPTPSQTAGPFFQVGLQWMARRDLVPRGSPGAITLHGRVFDGLGDPIPDGVVEIWQADAQGNVEPDRAIFGRFLTDSFGAYEFVTVKPGRVDDRQAPHIDVAVFARGLLQRVVSRIYFPDEDAANANDPLLASIPETGHRNSLLAVADGDRLRFDIHLQGERETAFLVW